MRRHSSRPCLWSNAASPLTAADSTRLATSAPATSIRTPARYVGTSSVVSSAHVTTRSTARPRSRHDAQACTHRRLPGGTSAERPATKAMPWPASALASRWALGESRVPPRAWRTASGRRVQGPRTSASRSWGEKRRSTTARLATRRASEACRARGVMGASADCITSVCSESTTRTPRTRHLLQQATGGRRQRGQRHAEVRPRRVVVDHPHVHTAARQACLRAQRAEKLPCCRVGVTFGGAWARGRWPPCHAAHLTQRVHVQAICRRRVSRGCFCQGHRHLQGDAQGTTRARHATGG